MAKKGSLCIKRPHIDLSKTSQTEILAYARRADEETARWTHAWIRSYNEGDNTRIRLRPPGELTRCSSKGISLESDLVIAVQGPHQRSNLIIVAQKDAGAFFELPNGFRPSTEFQRIACRTAQRYILTRPVIITFITDVLRSTTVARQGDVILELQGSPPRFYYLPKGSSG